MKLGHRALRACRSAILVDLLVFGPRQQPTLRHRHGAATESALAKLRQDGLVRRARFNVAAEPFMLTTEGRAAARALRETERADLIAEIERAGS